MFYCSSSHLNYGGLDKLTDLSFPLIPFNMFQSKQKGFIGISISAGLSVPMTNSSEGIAATQRTIDFMNLNKLLILMGNEQLQTEIPTKSGFPIEATRRFDSYTHKYR